MLQWEIHCQSYKERRDDSEKVRFTIPKRKEE